MSHLVRLGRVHRAVGVVVHHFVDAANGLEAEQRVLVVTELPVDDTQICTNESRNDAQSLKLVLRFFTSH